MKISIITVCFNAAKTIRDAMESVAKQHREEGMGKREQGLEIEYIVVDGGSSDGTVREIEDFASEVEGRREDDLGLMSRSRGGFSFKWISEKDRGLYDAMNKGIRMATGDVIGILNADDVLADENVLAKVASAFREQGIGNGDQVDGIYGDVRFVKELGGRTVRYCTGRWFRNWMFRFATLPAHPSVFLRRELFEKYGFYSLDYRICADFELLLRFFWTHRIRARYLPLCTTVMRLGGASTDGWRSMLEINREDVRALRANGYWSCLPLAYLKYLFKIWGFVRRG